MKSFTVTPAGIFDVSPAGDTYFLVPIAQGKAVLHWVTEFPKNAPAEIEVEVVKKSVRCERTIRVPVGGRTTEKGYYARWFTLSPRTSPLDVTTMGGDFVIQGTQAGHSTMWVSTAQGGTGCVSLEATAP